MNEFCSLWSNDSTMNNLNVSVGCWRGECIVCGWEKDRRCQRIAALHERGLTEATEAEVQAFLKKNADILSREAVEYIKKHGLHFYTVKLGGV